MAEERGQRLQWWQEERSESGSAAVKRLAAMPGTAAATVARTAEIVIPYDCRLLYKTRQALRKSGLLFLVVLLLSYGFYALSHVYPFSLVLCLIGWLVGEPASLYLKARRRIRDFGEPAFLLTPEGMGIHTLTLDRSMVVWKDIVDIRAWQGKGMMLTIKRLEGVPGKPTEDVWLPEETLPIPATALAARIAAYESGLAG